MKILQVISSLAAGFGGPTVALLNLSFALARKGQDVTIYSTNADVKSTLDKTLQKTIIVDNVRIVYFPIQFSSGYKFSIPYLSALKKNIPLFDIIHIHSLFQFSTLSASYYCHKYRKAYIIRTLGQLDPFLLRKKYLSKMLYYTLFEKRNMQRASALHFTSEREKAWAEGLHLQCDNIVIPLGVDADGDKRLPEYGRFRDDYPQLRNKKVILFLGRINFKKGLDILLKAFEIIASMDKDVFLVIAGPDNEDYSKVLIRTCIRNKSILESILFTGMLLDKRKLAAFKDSDVFVLPSYSENFGIAVVEAMSYGLPVIISNRVGISDEVMQYNAGLIIGCDVSQLVNAIVILLRNRELSKTLSENGKKLVADKFDIDKIANRMIDAYEKLLSKKYP